MLCRFRLVASAVPFVLTLNWLLATDVHSGLVAYYPFEGNFQDTTGNGNDGTPRGGPVFVQGVLGQALSLDGINDRVELPPVLMRDDFTVVFWMRTNQVAYDGGSWYEGISLVDGEVCTIHRFSTSVRAMTR
jgi:hypothetical protein